MTSPETTVTNLVVEFNREGLLRRVDLAEQTFDVIRQALATKLAEVDARGTEPEPAVQTEIDKCRALVGEVRGLIAEARARLA